MFHRKFGGFPRDWERGCAAEYVPLFTSAFDYRIFSPVNVQIEVRTISLSYFHSEYPSWSAYLSIKIEILARLTLTTSRHASAWHNHSYHPWILWKQHSWLYNSVISMGEWRSNFPRPASRQGKEEGCCALQHVTAGSMLWVFWGPLLPFSSAWIWLCSKGRIVSRGMDLIA